MAAKKPPREQFASRDDRRRYQIWQLQRGLVAAGALGLAACAAYAGTMAIDAAGLRQRAAVHVQEARLAAEQYQRITAAFPVTQTTTENLKAAVTQFQRIAERTAVPESALHHVSRVLQSFPQFQIDGLHWSVGPARELRDKPAAAPKPAAKGAEAAVRLEITGRVNATRRNDYRAITAQVQQFAGALGVSGYEVLRTQLPFDITSEGTLTGDMGGTRESGEPPGFTVVLMRRLP